MQTEQEKLKELWQDIEVHWQDGTVEPLQLEPEQEDAIWEFMDKALISQKQKMGEMFPKEKEEKFWARGGWIEGREWNTLLSDIKQIINDL